MRSRNLRTRRCTRGEWGFTLLEMLAAMAIGVFVMGGLVTIVYQLSRVTVEGQSELRAQHQLQNVASWLNRDVVAASQGVAGSTTLTLTQNYYTFGQDEIASCRTVGYTFSEEEGTLTRTEDGSSQVIGRRINSVSIVPLGPIVDTVAVTITAAYLDGERTSALKFDLRAAE
jgi:type II secretory pathway pseudopilin PulG